VSSRYADYLTMMDEDIQLTARVTAGTAVDEVVAITGAVFSSIALLATILVIVFVFLRGALFVSLLHFGLLLDNVLETSLLLVFSVLALTNSGSFVFDRLLVVFVTLLEILSILLLLKYYLEALYGEIL
jgi:hypothetical protein